MDMAKGIAEAALAECRSKGFHTAAVVVDQGGHVLVPLRDEQATPQTGELARRKAYTARMYRSTTMEWIARMQKDPVTAAAARPGRRDRARRRRADQGRR